VCQVRSNIFTYKVELVATKFDLRHFSNIHEILSSNITDSNVTKKEQTFFKLSFEIIRTHIFCACVLLETSTWCRGINVTVRKLK
jgi:hypothetical protein